ncbi:MAG: tyrosine-type recombinase/integrase [Deltaproteobacteria bacterium]|nr:tyrosine-type recombinase/integrase [Deltaproteobacteria bacterium]
MLKDPKSKKSRRSVLAPRELVYDLGLWKLKCSPASQRIVMATWDGKPLQGGAARDMLDAACVNAEVPRRTLHRLRHRFASLLLMRGRPLPEVSMLLGYRDIGITAKVYAHFIDQKTTAVQDLVSSVLGARQKVKSQGLLKVSTARRCCAFYEVTVAIKLCDASCRARRTHR